MLSSCNFIKPWLNEERNNILITSVGRRSYMVQYFKEALGNSGEVHVSNSSTITPAFRLADKAVKSPLIYDKDYIPFLLNLTVNQYRDYLASSSCGNSRRP